MVIQRWQSVMLLVTFALMACFTFLSLGQVQTQDFTDNFTCLGFAAEGEMTAPETVVNQSTWFLFILSLMSTILPFINIFLYKNLPLQKRVCVFEIMFLIATIVVAAYEGYCAYPVAVAWSSLALAPFLALILMIMAWRLINRDHNLLRSVDRIR